MKNLLIAVGVIAALIIAYFALSIEPSKTVSDGSATFSSSELGFEFRYPSGPTGYVLEERTPSQDEKDLVRTLVLMQSEDKAQIDRGGAPVGGEGPPTITINVFTNERKQFPLAWANENIQYSNINLKTQEPSEYVLGGANAIRYPADGLYAFDNVVVAHGAHIYVFSGMYLDAASQLRADFTPLLQSVRFIPAPGQE